MVLSEAFAKHQNILQDHFMPELHMAGLNKTSVVGGSDARAEALPGPLTASASGVLLGCVMASAPQTRYAGPRKACISAWPVADVPLFL